MKYLTMKEFYKHVENLEFKCRKMVEDPIVKEVLEQAKTLETKEKWAITDFIINQKPATNASVAALRWIKNNNAYAMIGKETKFEMVFLLCEYLRPQHNVEIVLGEYKGNSKGEKFYLYSDYEEIEKRYKSDKSRIAFSMPIPNIDRDSKNIIRKYEEQSCWTLKGLHFYIKK